jgi:hypothetical protein
MVSGQIAGGASATAAASRQPVEVQLEQDSDNDSDNMSQTDTHAHVADTENNVQAVDSVVQTGLTGGRTTVLVHDRFGHMPNTVLVKVACLQAQKEFSVSSCAWSTLAVVPACHRPALHTMC